MDPFLGEIRLMPFSFAPKGWLECNGQILNISQNQALAALIGNKFGGDGKTTFALPDLRGRIPLHMGTDGQFGLGTANIGTQEGTETVVLTTASVPAHTHTFGVSKDAATAIQPSGAYAGKGEGIAWIAPVDRTKAMAADLLATSGGDQGHENRMPVLALRFCIATTGLWPPRD